ncbi:MAG: chromosomal replication initiator protein DnaA [Lachnospiraceae bacterium]|nr:chromosomal replication initiator protein DnaA [Lachnospiraceae bacterium]
MHAIQENWELIKETIKREYELSNVVYATWIKNLKFHSVEDHVVTISIASDQSHILEYIIRKYKDFFQVTICEMMNDFYEINFILENVANENSEEPAENTSSEKIDLYRQANLATKYTFDNFVVGSNNNFAQSACLAVAESPGEVFNPLFIYGGSGLGKTHLMHSIGHYILDHNPNMKVLYVNSETFTNEVIESIRSGNSSSMNKLRDKYRTVDVLLIDDIQFIIGKESTQEEFFHTFNTLYNNGKAIIISSDKHPKQMETLDERFSSRFQMGLPADIQPPNYETRVAILLKIAEPYNKTGSISNEIIEYIATNIKSNIRELEGAFNKLIAFAKINNKPITMELAEEALKDMIYPDKPKLITPTIIIQVVAEHYGVNAQDITSKKRNAEFVLPRQVVMYLCRELTDISLTNIGKILDRKDHTTVLHGVNKIEEQLATNSELAQHIEIIKKKIIPN